jgi:hypothetical protein
MRYLRPLQYGSSLVFSSTWRYDVTSADLVHVVRTGYTRSCQWATVLWTPMNHTALSSRSFE